MERWRRSDERLCAVSSHMESMCMKISPVVFLVALTAFVFSSFAFADGEDPEGTRQVHLDFHTSELIPDIGKHFSKEQFQGALKLGRVNYINIFGKGHHGLAYFPTKVGQMHPNLDFDLLGAQIEACHEIGVTCPVYYTVGLSEQDALKHPEWVMRHRDGSLQVKHDSGFADAKPMDPKPEGQWYRMCLNTGYHEHMMEQVKELCEGYDLDGVWFDIYNVNNPCFCDDCSTDMRAEGVDFDDLEEVVAFRVKAYKRHQRELKELIAGFHPDAVTFFNGTTAIFTPENFKYEMYEYNTFQDLEDLPTTSWCDYDRQPLQSKYFLEKGYHVAGMSGKFHKGWGEFGGFKHRNAIKYEAAAMISWGVHCNFGDQLHPSGLMDMSTYENIGYAYEYVEQIEAYGIGGLPEARLGVWRSYDHNHDEALVKMLLQEQANFNVANDRADLSSFDVIVIPDKPCVSEEDAKRLNEFAKSGGGLLVLGRGALDATGSEMVLDLGVEYLGAAEFDIDYLVLGESLNDGLVKSPFLNYSPALRVDVKEGTDVLASIREPYFSRTMNAFSGHKNTPYKLEDADHPGITRKGNAIFFAHDLGRLYNKHGAVLHRQMFKAALDLLNTSPLVQTDMPSSARMSLLHQKERNRYVVHLLYGPTILRGDYEIIEDLPPLHDTSVWIDLPVKVKKAYLAPSGEELELKGVDGRFLATVPEFSCHTAIVLEY